MWLIVRLAKGPVEVDGVERSRQQDFSLLRVQGVWDRKAEAGRMMCALEWLAMEVELVEEEAFVTSELPWASPASGG